MSFEVKDKDLAGRIGKLSTRSGTIETPAFFPVINPFKQKTEVPVSKIREIGFSQIITNAYIIKQRYGDAVEGLNVHKITGFDGVVMTDSGAYQLLMYGKERVIIDPIEIVEFQVKIKSDIAVIADIPTRDDASYEEAQWSVNETLKRARQVLHLIKDTDAVWVLPIQGGVHIDLVRKSALEATKIPYYSMYAIGSPVTVLEKYEFWKVVDMVATAKIILPPDKPVHLFGGGHPIMIPLFVALGIDSFDSASYILYARENRYMTEHGTYRLEDLDYFPCECEVCSKYTPKELIEMNKSERVTLIAIHNLHVINREIKRVKVAIREGRLWELIEERARTHPSIREALNALLKYIDWIEKLDPRVKGDIHGIFLYDTSSYYRPELYRHRRSLLDKVRGIKQEVIALVPCTPLEKPFRYSTTFSKARDYIIKNTDIDPDNVCFMAYLPFFDVVPIDIDQTYPYSQFEAPLSISNELINMMIRNINTVLSTLISSNKRIRKILFFTCRMIRWGQRELLEEKAVSAPVRQAIEFIEICEDR